MTRRIKVSYVGISVLENHDFYINVSKEIKKCFVLPIFRRMQAIISKKRQEFIICL